MATSVAVATPGAAAGSAPDAEAGSAGPSAGLTGADFFSPDDQLHRLIGALLDENPGVLSAWARSRSGYERVPQERSLPDPQLSYRLLARTPETRVGPQEQMLELSQGIPWAGKRDLQARRVESLASGATWEAEDLERALVAQLKRSYFEAAYLQEAITVNSEELDLLRRFESIALKRYATGVGIQQNVVKVQTDISRLVDRETELRERLAVVVRRIAELAGRPDGVLDLVPIDLPVPDVDYDRARLESDAVASHPRVRAVGSRIEADRLLTRRRHLESRPDFRFGLGYTLVDEREDFAGLVSPPQDNGKDILAVTVGVNIPIYRKRIRAGVAEASESLQAERDLLESVRNRLRYDVQEAHLRLEASGERARLYRDVIVPQAEESLASAEAAYTTNRQGFLDLLDAERILFEARLAYHRLIADSWVALADLELAVGRRFPGANEETGRREDGGSATES